MASVKKKVNQKKKNKFIWRRLINCHCKAVFRFRKKSVNKTHSDVKRKAEMRWKIGVNKERRENRRKWSELSTVWCGSEWYVERRFIFFQYVYAYKGAFLLLKTHIWERENKMKSTVLCFYVCLPFKLESFFSLHLGSGIWKCLKWRGNAGTLHWNV